MTRKEFIKKWCWAPETAGDCHQITWDLLEEIRETLEDPNVTNDTAVGSICYKVDNLLEVVDKTKPDYDFWIKFKKDIEPEEVE
jgi:hypothetical protein